MLSQYLNFKVFQILKVNKSTTFYLHFLTYFDSFNKELNKAPRVHSDRRSCGRAGLSKPNVSKKYVYWTRSKYEAKVPKLYDS